MTRNPDPSRLGTVEDVNGSSISVKLSDGTPTGPENQIKSYFQVFGVNLSSVDLNNKQKTDFHQNGEKTDSNRGVGEN